MQLDRMITSIRFTLLLFALAPIALLGQTGNLTTTSTSGQIVLSVPGEELVPAALGVRTDRKGHSWNVERNGNLGRIGSTMVNSGLFLTVNQQKFDTFQPRMTRDGKEFVIHGRPLENLKGIQITRRVRFIEDTGALRYMELFFNSSPSPVTLSIELGTSFSGNYKSTVSNRANLEPVLLKDGEAGILVTPGSSQSNRGFLFVLCGTDANDKPTISAQSRYGLKFQYQLTLAPGETKGIAHVVSQTIIPQELNKKTLAKIFAPYLLKSDKIEMAPAFDDSIVNRSLSSGQKASLIDSNHSFESLNVIQGDSDTLALGEQTRLFGTASFNSFKIKTDYGDATIDAQKLIAISGKNRGLRERVRMYLDDGQVLSGEVPEGEISFAMKGGGNMKIGFDKLDRLVLAKGDPKTTPETTSPQGSMIMTWNGDQLHLDGDNDLLFFGLTPWGEISFTLSDLIWLVPLPDDDPGYQVKLTDGTECRIFLSGRDLILNSDYLGELILHFNQVRGIIPNQKKTTDASLTRVRLTGDQWIVGTLAGGKLSMHSNGQPLTIDPGEIRKFTRINDDRADPINPRFLVELWDGSRIEGIIHSGSLPLTVREEEWQLPLADIVELQTPGPLLDSEKRSKVVTLIAKLGDEKWQIREKATLDLSQLGNLTLPILNRELNRNPDPEVRRRIERILDNYKDSY